MTMEELREFLSRLAEDNKEYYEAEEQSYLDRTGDGTVGGLEKEVYAKALSVRRDTGDIEAALGRIQEHEAAIADELENIRLSIASLMPDRKVRLAPADLNIDFKMDED